MIKTSGFTDPLGRPLASCALVVGALLAALLITGSVWPSPTRSERPSLDKRLCPISVRARAEADVECRAGLARARSEPASEQIGELIACGAGGTRDVAELLHQTELPDRAVDTHVDLSRWERVTSDGRELQDRIALVPEDATHEALRARRVVSPARAVLREATIGELSREACEGVRRVLVDRERGCEPIVDHAKPRAPVLLLPCPGFDGIAAPVGEPSLLRRLVEIDDALVLGDVVEELGRAAKDPVRTERELADRKTRRECVRFEEGLERDHLEALGHLGDLDLAEEGRVLLGRPLLLDSEVLLRAHEVEPAAVARAEPCRWVAHSFKLTGAGPLAALEPDLAVRAFDLVGAAHAKEAGLDLLCLERQLDGDPAGRSMGSVLARTSRMTTSVAVATSARRLPSNMPTHSPSTRPFVAVTGAGTPAARASRSSARRRRTTAGTALGCRPRREPRRAGRSRA